MPAGKFDDKIIMRLDDVIKQKIFDRVRACRTLEDLKALTIPQDHTQDYTLLMIAHHMVVLHASEEDVDRFLRFAFPQNFISGSNVMEQDFILPLAEMHYASNLERAYSTVVQPSSSPIIFTDLEDYMGGGEIPDITVTYSSSYLPGIPEVLSDGTDSQTSTTTSTSATTLPGNPPSEGIFLSCCLIM